MAEKKRSYFGAATFFVFLLIVLLIALMGRYERTRRVERFAEEQARFEALSESLPDMDEVRRLQVVLKYRPQPLDTVARRQVRNITGRRKVYGSDQVLTFLSMAFDGIDFWQNIPCIGVDYGRNREFLGMLAADSMATPRQVRESAALRAQSDSLTGKSMDMLQPVDQEVHKLYGALRTLERGFAETLIMVPPTKRAMASDENADRLTWMHPRDAIAAGHPEEPAKEARVALTDLEKAWKARDMAAVNASAKRLDVACRAMDPTGLMQSEEEIDAELSFSQAAPFVRASWLFFGCAALVLFGALFRVAWVRWLGIISGIVGLALMAWGFYLRITLGFGVAVHNLYESMIAVAFSGMAICIIIDLARKTSWALPAGGLAAFIVLELVDQMSGKFDDAIGAPIAVLANNFWIHIHVPIVMVAYTAFFIAFILSVVALPWILFRDRHARSPELKSLLSTATIAVNIGTPLMFAGLILGGIWASESWGRFWGWDPKETWALVLFLYYTAMVHGRFTKWLNPFWSALGMFFGGVVLFFTYYGTNEFLTGLHSYAGASQDGGFWENMFHAKNLWFTVPCGIVMFLSIVVAPILYYVIPAKTPELDDDGSATTSKVDDDRMDGATARPIQG